jgi:glycolate oxidase FAD binding subunit
MAGNRTMPAALQPSSLAELATMVRATPRVLAVGGRTKPRLSAGTDATPLLLTGVTGIVEYDPAEFTVTALAGTRLRDLQIALARHGQHLPFDPPLADAGATVGGMLAAGLAGPGRFRFGGVRDFVLGVRLIDGAGRELRLGGKVVKNAAGFDVPKFLAGSLGRFGVIGEATFKVFPRPETTLTLRLPTASLAATLALLATLGRSRYELEALDVAPDGLEVLARLAGPADALPDLARDLLARHRGEAMPSPAAETLWAQLRDFRWSDPAATLLKVPCSLASLPALEEAVGAVGGRRHLSAGGDVAFIALDDEARTAALSSHLDAAGLSALMLRGHGPLMLGRRTPQRIDAAVKAALDPVGRFPSLSD